MSTEPEYEPSPEKWVRDQVEAIEAAGNTNAAQVMDRPVILMTTRGARSGKIRKVPVMRVEHDGVQLAVASKGGAPEHPQWYHNLVAHPEVEVMVDTERYPATAREISGDERAEWWERAVAAYPPYADYQTKTSREIPLFVLERR
ncbi:nitroreductase family deazaflavin-dependent oxidoreductase [Auraticoccus monumenti]|uniref:Deazaflavin-dependent oxidoreductase, nitroreductase family n=1 Tax=Auraticoccus monumenti TaxID=675864 RepID=A0A1G6VWI2_9ACTN|nr:nitroreductase family deazaflavin-dependent oxidoreductase [Auraticoccus monumenti]SDD57773.1 deazaflavin-dependent oxidoreductase, nitroreductase family [Auraticoccus monumenti]